MRPVRVTELLLVLLAGSALAAERKACVPAAEQRWLCGDAATLRDRPASSAGLPAPPAPPLPPVLLIDPDRLFVPAPPRAPSQRGPATPGAVATTAAPAEISAGRTAPDRAEQPSAAPSEPPPRGSHVWQLARASSPDGFAALRRARGIAADSTRSVQTRRGDWLLLYGDFPSIEAARNARAQAGAGFARAWAQIEAER